MRNKDQARKISHQLCLMKIDQLEAENLRLEREYQQIADPVSMHWGLKPHTSLCTCPNCARPITTVDMLIGEFTKKLTNSFATAPMILGEGMRIDFDNMREKGLKFEEDCRQIRKNAEQAYFETFGEYPKF